MVTDNDHRHDLDKVNPPSLLMFTCYETRNWETGYWVLVKVNTLTYTNDLSCGVDLSRVIVSSQSSRLSLLAPLLDRRAILTFCCRLSRSLVDLEEVLLDKAKNLVAIGEGALFSWTKFKYSSILRVSPVRRGRRNRAGKAKALNRVLYI